MRRNDFPYGLQARNKRKQDTKNLRQKDTKKKLKVHMNICPKVNFFFLGCIVDARQIYYHRAKFLSQV